MKNQQNQMVLEKSEQNIAVKLGLNYWNRADIFFSIWKNTADFAADEKNGFPKLKAFEQRAAV